LLAVATFGVHLALGIVLARSLGPDGSGGYAYVLAMVTLMAVPAQLGLPTLVVRETARAHAMELWGTMRGLWRWTTAAAGAFSLALALVALGLAWLFRSEFTASELATFRYGLLLIPLIALGNLRGLRRAVAGQVPEAVLRPGILILLIAAAALFDPAKTLTATEVMGFHALAAAVALAIGAWMLWRARPAPLTRRPAAAYEASRWLAAGLPLALLAGIHTINSHTDIIMLGLFRPAEDVGVLRVVVQGGKLVLFGQGAVNLVVAPYMARFHATDDPARLQRVVTLSARANLAMAVPVTLAFVFFGEPILQLMFGVEYARGRAALAVLAVGQLATVVWGPCGLLLNMSGFERDSARSGAIAAVSNIALNLILIPWLGLTGAALATSLTLWGWTALLWSLVRKRIGVNTLATRLERRIPHA
jgi:O-antigen/teichoic acid export membrane protein